jgi:hypothetical protein
LSVGEWYFSSETNAARRGPDWVDVELTGLGLVRKPAQIGLAPVLVLEGEPSPVNVDRWGRYLPRSARDRLERAVAQVRSGDAQLTLIDRAPPPSIRRLEGRSLDSLSPVELLQLQEDQLWERKTAHLPVSQFRWRPSVITRVH